MAARKGFTLAEILISLALGLVLFGAIATSSIAFTRHRQLDATADVAVTYLRTAAMRASQSESNIPHGVSFSGDRITLFRGESFGSRQTDGDTVWTRPNYVTVTGPIEIVFGKQTAIPSTSGNIIFSNGRETVTVMIYPTGAVSQP